MSAKAPARGTARGTATYVDGAFGHRIERIERGTRARAERNHGMKVPRAGHVPIVGEWLALPLVALAGSRRVGDDAFDEVFHPIAVRLLERCDGVLRVGGASAGADLMVDLARQRGLRVFHTLGEVPGCA